MSSRTCIFSAGGVIVIHLQVDIRGPGLTMKWACDLFYDRFFPRRHNRLQPL